MFAIYFPGKTGASLKHFHDAGLGDLLGGDADRSPSFVDFLPGPDGKPGVCATWIQRAIIQGEFDWTPCRNGQFYLGFVACEKPPRPQDFQRERVQLGTAVRLADGNEWQIPIARQLPQLLALDGDDRWSPAIAPGYKRFWDASWKTLDWFVPNDEGIISVDFQSGADFIALALGVNYRVNRDVASWLGLIRSDLFWPVAKAVTEFDDLIAAQEKKTASDGQLTSAGATA